MGDALKLVSVLFLVIYPVILAGCTKNPEKKPVVPRLKVAIALSDMKWDGNQIMRKVIEKRSKKEGVDVTWLDAENDPREQKKQIEQLLKKRTRQLKAVVIQAVDAGQVSPLVENLVKENIKVIALEALPPNVPLDGYIAFDHNLAAKLQVNYVLNALSQQLPVSAIILRGDDQTSKEIAAAIRDNTGASQIQIIDEIEAERNNAKLASPVLQQALNKSIDVIFTTDSRLAVGAVEVLKYAGLSDKVVTLGVGANKDASRELLTGKHDAEVDTMPELMGQYVFDAAVSLASTNYWHYDTRVTNGNYNIPSCIVPVRLIQKSNTYLLKQRWGKEIKGEQKEGEESGSSGEGGQPEKKEQDRKKTKLRIITQDGKTMEVEIPGEIKSIESTQAKSR